MYVSKEKAKQIIDEAPGMIWIDSFNGMTLFIQDQDKLLLMRGKE